MATNGPRLLGTAAMERLRHHLLARAAFAENQDRGAVGATLRMKVKTACICGLAPSMSSNDVGPAALLQGVVFLLEFRHVDASPQHQPEFVHFHRLAQEVVGAGPDGMEGVLPCRPGPTR